MPLTLSGFALQSFPLPESRAPLEARCFLAVGHSLELSLLTPGRRSPVSISSVWLAVACEAGPSRKGPLRLSVPRRSCSAGQPSASSVPKPCLLALHTGFAAKLTGADRVGHGTGPSSPRILAWSAFSTPASKLYSFWKSVRAVFRVFLNDDGRCSRGLLPLQSFPSFCAGSGNFPSSDAPPDTACAVNSSTAEATLLSRPFPNRAASRTIRRDLRVSGNRKIGLSLSGLPALLGFPTSSVSHAYLASTRPSIIDSRQGRRRVTAAPGTRLRVVISAD